MTGREQGRYVVLLVAVVLAMVLAGCSLFGGSEEKSAEKAGRSGNEGGEAQVITTAEEETTSASDAEVQETTAQEPTTQEPAAQETAQSETPSEAEETTSGGAASDQGQGGTPVEETTVVEEESGGQDDGTGAREPAAETNPEPAFTAASRASGGSGGEATSILAVRFGQHEGYERVVIDLGTGNGPATSVPEWRLLSPTGDGLMRITFPSVSSTGTTDGSFSGSLLGSYYVVRALGGRAPDGALFVDIFATKAFSYRVKELSNPARLVVDFATSGASLAIPLPAQSGNTVLMDPRRGATVGDTFTVSGYGRNFEATNNVILEDASGNAIAGETVMSNDWAETWGYFETTVSAPSFSGEGTLKAGAMSARDGSFQGVEIPVSGG